MTAATLVPAPLRDMLAWVIGDAVRYREPDREGCCEKKEEPCGDHAGDKAIAGAMRALLGDVESAEDDDELIAALRACAPLVLAEIARYTEDGDGGDRDDV